MAEGISTRLTAAQGRRFGATVGGAFLFFAAIAWWRGHPVTTNVLGALGLALVAAGLVVPTALGPVERAWMGLAKAISKVTTPIIMGLMYLLVLTVVGVLRRFLGGNPLVHVSGSQGYWRERPVGGRQSASMHRQF